MSERDEFEAAWRARYPDHGDSAFRRSELITYGYANTRVNDGWAMWQSARKGYRLLPIPPEPPPHPGPPPLPPACMVVPIHPTKEMRDAGAKIGNQGWDFAHHTWRTMLLHAPAAPQQATTALTDGQIKELAGMHGGYLEDCDAWNFCGDRGLVRFARSLLATSPVKESSNG